MVIGEIFPDFCDAIRAKAGMFFSKDFLEIDDVKIFSAAEFDNV